MRAAVLRTAVVVAVFLLWALVLEVGLRLFTESGYTLLLRDQRVGKRYREGFSGRVYVPESDREILLRFNRDGYRGPDRPRDKPPGERRLAVLGDSFVAAVAVEEEETMVDLLEERLSRPGAAWEVLSFGASGYSTAQSLLTFRHFARAYHPDLVVAAFTVANDLSDNSRELSHARRPYFELDAGGDLVLIPMNRLRTAASRALANSRFYNWLKDSMRKGRWALYDAVGLLGPGMQVFNTRPEGEVERAWAITEALFLELREEAAAVGAAFAVVVIPHGCQYDEVMWREVVDKVPAEEAPAFDPGYPGRRLEESLGRHGIPVLSLRPAFREARPGGVLNWYEGEGHWNERGHRVAAAEIHRWLLREGLLGSGQARRTGAR